MLYDVIYRPYTLVVSSDVARPLSYKTKTTYFFKTKTGQAKTKTSKNGLKTILRKSLLLEREVWAQIPNRSHLPHNASESLLLLALA